MSMTQLYAPHLPYLRRYARALAGSQASGDTYVRAALTALLAGDAAISEGVAPRVGLYKVFHAIWSSASEHIDDEIHSGDIVEKSSDPGERLASLDAQKRAALLLTAVEGFNLNEAAFILEESVDAVERAIVDAQHLIDRQLVSRILIIEDEPIIALDLKNLVTELGHKVVGIASTRKEAVQKALAERPGLVLADINLGEGGSGIEKGRPEGGAPSRSALRGRLVIEDSRTGAVRSRPAPQPGRWRRRWLGRCRRRAFP